MKKPVVMAAALLLSVSAFAQGPVTRYLEGRFGAPGSQTFIEKGSHAFGISGGYRSLGASGDDTSNAGYALLSLLNIGDGQLKIWNVSPSYSTFIANDLSLGVALNYSGYAVDTDLRLDLRDIINTTSEDLNLVISNRSMRHHAGGASVVLRKYVPFFGSQYVAVFGEGRLYGSYGTTSSAPRDLKDFNRERVSQTIGVGLKAGGGLAVKLKDGSAITVSVPIFGIAYSYSIQDKTTTVKNTVVDPETGQETTTTSTTKSKTHMSNFNASRSTDLLGIQFGFVRYIEPKRK